MCNSVSQRVSPTIVIKSYFMLWNAELTTKLNRGCTLSFNSFPLAASFRELQVVSLEHTSIFEANSVSETTKQSCQKLVTVYFTGFISKGKTVEFIFKQNN